MSRSESTEPTYRICEACETSCASVNGHGLCPDCATLWASAIERAGLVQNEAGEAVAPMPHCLGCKAEHCAECPCGDGPDGYCVDCCRELSAIWLSCPGWDDCTLASLMVVNAESPWDDGEDYAALRALPVGGSRVIGPGGAGITSLVTRVS